MYGSCLIILIIVFDTPATSLAGFFMLKKVLSHHPWHPYYCIMNKREQFGNSASDRFIADRYIDSVLTEEGKIIFTMQGDAIERYGLVREGLMKKERGFKVTAQNLEMHVIKYLRFHDMKGKKQAVIFGEKATRGRRQQYHLYNRIVFGRLNAISNKVMYGFTEAIRNQFKAEYNIPQ